MVLFLRHDGGCQGLAGRHEEKFGAARLIDL